MERWIAINRSIAKLRNTVAITNHRSEWRRGCTSKYANIMARGFRSRSMLTSFPSQRSVEDFSSLGDESCTRIYDATETICYSASIAHRRYFVLNPKYVCGSSDNARVTRSLFVLYEGNTLNILHVTRREAIYVSIFPDEHSHRLPLAIFRYRK